VLRGNETSHFQEDTSAPFSRYCSAAAGPAAANRLPASAANFDLAESQAFFSEVPRFEFSRTG
jgi:hypothetical protein